MMVSKCCGDAIAMVPRGIHGRTYSKVGVYCKRCGKWQKWASKGEFEEYMEKYLQLGCENEEVK